jgi:cytochrome P450
MRINDFRADDPQLWSRPEEFFAVARAQCPVAELPGGGGFVITRYEDVRAASMRVREFSNTRPVFGAGDPELEEIAARGYPEVATLTNNDPPEHTRFRKLVYKAFVPEVVAGLEPKITALAHELIDRVAGRGEMDFVADFSQVLPIMVMADALGDFQHYFAAEIEKLHSAPGDDVVSHLVHAKVDGERSLDVPEILDVVRALLVAGNDTTTNLLGGATLALLDHPDQLAEVQADRSLVPPMVEEALRYVSPARWTMRKVLGDGAEIGGCPISAGARAGLGWGSANRDASIFNDPDQFDIRRDSSAHMAFGHGIHFCIGKDLARAEGRIVFNALFDRITDLELTVPREEIKPMPMPGVNRLNKLPIRFKVR